VLFAAPAFAQSHPCDANPPSSATVNAGSLFVGWCHNRLDVQEQPTTVTSWALYANTTRTALTNVTTNGVANAAGLVFYRATVNFTQGNYTVYVVGLNSAGEAPRGDPFLLNAGQVNEAVPSPVMRTRITVS